MNLPPNGRDPDETEPIPVTPRTAPSQPVSPPPISPTPAPPNRPPVAFVHRFGNVPLYLVARLLAFAIDVGLVGFVIATFVFNTFEPGGLTVYSSHDAAGFGTVAAASFGAALAVAFLCEALFGTTLGKAIFALHVRRRDGGHAGVGRVFVRYLVRPIDLVVIGPVLALVTPRHQRLGDFAGGTVVARSRLGPFASLLGIAFLAGLVYIQYAFGGGARSAFGVGAETANFGPALIAQGAAFFGVALAHPAPTLPFSVPTPAPKAAPSDEPSDVPEAAASDAPSDEETDAPREPPATDAPGAAPETDAPREPPATDAPGAAPATDAPREPPATDAPGAAPATDAPRETPARDEPRETPATDARRVMPSMEHANDPPSQDPSDPAQQAPSTAASDAAAGV